MQSRARSSKTTKGGYISVQELVYNWYLEEVSGKIHDMPEVCKDGYDDWVAYNLDLVWRTGDEECPLDFDSHSSCYVHVAHVGPIVNAVKIFLRGQLRTSSGKTQLSNLFLPDREASEFMLIGLVGANTESKPRGAKTVVMLQGGDLLSAVLVNSAAVQAVESPDLVNAASVGGVHGSVTVSTVSSRLRLLPANTKPLRIGHVSLQKSSGVGKRKGRMSREEESDSDFSCDASDDEDGEYELERDRLAPGESASTPGPSGAAATTRIPGGAGSVSSTSRQIMRKRMRADFQARGVATGAKSCVSAAGGAPRGGSGVQARGVATGAKSCVAKPGAPTGVAAARGNPSGGSGIAGGPACLPGDLLPPLLREAMANIPTLSSDSFEAQWAHIALLAVGKLRSYPSAFAEFLELANLRDTKTKKSMKAVEDTSRKYSAVESALRAQLALIQSERRHYQIPVCDSLVDIESFLEKLPSLVAGCEHGFLHAPLFKEICTTLRAPLLILWFMERMAAQLCTATLMFPDRARVVMKDLIHDARLDMKYPDTYLESGGYYDHTLDKFEPFEYTVGYTGVCTPSLKHKYVQSLGMYAEQGLPLCCQRYLARTDLEDEPEYGTMYASNYAALPAVIAWKASARRTPREYIIFQFTASETIAVKAEPA